MGDLTTQRFETMEVTHKDNPSFRMHIRVADFDPNIHTPVGAAPSPVTPSTPASSRKKIAEVPPAPIEPPSKPVFGVETEDVLKTMTVKSLMTLPEIKFIEKPATKKEDLVVQIIAVREKYK